MGVRGTKPKPKAMHELQGTYRTTRHEKVWTPISDEFVMPEWLSKNAEEHFRFFQQTLRGMGCESSTFSMAVSDLSEAFAERQRLRKLAEETGGPVIEQRLRDSKGHVTDETILKANPAYKLYMDQDKRFFSMLTEFGLTPSSMSRLKGLEQQKKTDDPFADLVAMQ